MFGWFRSRAQRRDIFEYWDGKRKRRVDPLVIHRRLWGDPTFDAVTVWEKSDEGDVAALGQMIDFAATLFGVVRYDEQKAPRGLTDSEIVELQRRFLSYMIELKKRHNPTPTSPQSTDSTSASPAAEVSTTPPESDSSSTPPEWPGDANLDSSRPSLELQQDS